MKCGVTSGVPIICIDHKLALKCGFSKSRGHLERYLVLAVRIVLSEMGTKNGRPVDTVILELVTPSVLSLLPPC